MNTYDRRPFSFSFYGENMDNSYVTRFDRDGVCSMEIEHEYAGSSDLGESFDSVFE